MALYSRPITTAPEQLVTNGNYNLGCFNTPVKKANLIDYPNPYKLPLPKALKGLQLREWQAFQLHGKDHFIMVAIYNAKKISLVQFIVYDIKNNKKIKYEKKVPAWQLNVPDSLYNSVASYTSNNFSLRAEHDLATGKLELTANIKNFGGLPEVKARFKGLHDVKDYTPMVVCNPFSTGRVMYSHKCLMPMSGELTIGDKHISFEKETSQLIIDDHKGYYPYPTVYDWVTGLGRDKEGRIVGFNLTNNQVINQEQYNENCLWLDGALHPLPPIKVSRPDGVQGTWQVKDEYDMVNLQFTPIIHTSVNINLLILRSKYEGPYGFFNGYLKKSTGEKVILENIFGMGEDFYLRA
ncbi:MAG TPA: DUF2804 domain-containing protein [Chitinophagales bacterium]|nr:DUF2804 domain-containing protein [Chitinophagales bacterium]